jgi:hypothetical protein
MTTKTVPEGINRYTVLQNLTIAGLPQFGQFSIIAVVREEGSGVLRAG